MSSAVELTCDFEMTADESASRPAADGPSEIIERFKELIRVGKLKPGCRLPAERNLAGLLGVSRPTLRQALKALHLLKILEIKPRRGTFVTTRSPNILQEPLHFAVLLNAVSEEELVETRQLLEVHLAGLAAMHADSDDHLAMQESLARMIAAMNKPAEWLQSEFRFHESLARGAKNKLMFSIMQMLARLLQTHRFATVQSLIDYNESFQIHYRIFEQIQKRDPSAARAAMQAHFDYLTARHTIQRK